jgi:hypothetical protein
MRLRTIAFSLSMFLLVAAAPASDVKTAVQASDWTYQGCFAPTGTTCYDVYTHNGGYWMCDACRTTKRPSENKCRQLSSAQLANGRWCS